MFDQKRNSLLRLLIERFCAFNELGLFARSLRAFIGGLWDSNERSSPSMRSCMLSTSEIKPSRQMGGTLSAVVSADSGSANLVSDSITVVDRSDLFKLQSKFINILVKKDGVLVQRIEICSVISSFAAEERALGFVARFVFKISKILVKVNSICLCRCSPRIITSVVNSCNAD